MRRLLILLGCVALLGVAMPFLIATPSYLLIRSEALAVEPIAEPPPLFANAVLAAEDPSFLERTGLQRLADTYGPLLAGSPGTLPRGASISGLLTRATEGTSANRSVFVRMAVYVMVEVTLPRKSVLALYLRTVYLGSSPQGPIRGIERASLALFAKPKEQMNAAEAALIAGMIKSPAMFSPRTHPVESKARRNWVLKRMLDGGQIAKAEYERSLNVPLPSNA